MIDPSLDPRLPETNMDNYPIWEVSFSDWRVMGIEQHIHALRLAWYICRAGRRAGRVVRT